MGLEIGLHLGSKVHPGDRARHKIQCMCLAWRQAAHTAESTVHPVDGAGDRHSYDVAVVV